ncbi:MAG: VCBS repeat-containing protein [Pyrinomonadaceae bacterium]|nr:VCBS repeat-containing protein [Pyrinomonadaceae bacterium]
MNALLSIARISVMAVSIIVLAAIATPAVTYNAIPGTLGAIPDGPSGCGTFGAERDVTFTVSGFTGPLTHVSVNITGAHTWVGDMDVVLSSPGSIANRIVFSRTGALSASACGDDSNFSGQYSFADGSPASENWWEAAAAAPNSTAVVAPGSYRATIGGGDPGGGGNTLMLPSFVGLSNAQINGTWTLRFRDGGGGDSGAITAASLSLNSVTEGQHVVDMNGDTRTDWTLVRNIGGGPTGQVAWFTSYNGSGGGQTDVFGTAADNFVSGDFDGDKKADVAVWRSNPIAAFFYILRSSDSTFVPIQWGITGDKPEVVGDYDGDNKADCAVYRSGASAGQQSFWHILKSSDGGYLPIQWGQNGDFEAPGDYDGDGRMDAAVQRNAGGGSAIFFIRYFNGTFSQIVFGTPTDVIVPGDYDGDGKTDLAVTRGVSGQMNWFYDPSSIPGTQIVQTIFGASATDFRAQGDYDGDGRTDQAVWRPSATPGQSAFFVNGSATGFFAFQHGQNGDYPVANFNSH